MRDAARGLPARARRPRPPDLLRDEGQLEPRRAADLRARRAAASTSSRAASSSACSRIGARPVAHRVLGRRQDARRDASRARGRRGCASTSRAKPSSSCCRRSRRRPGARARQPARQPRRRRRHAPVHLDRPEGQQVRHRARQTQWPSTAAPPRCRASRWSASTATSARRSPRSGPYLDALDRVLDLVEAVEAHGIAPASPRPRRRPRHHLHRRDAAARPTRWSRALLARIDARGHGHRQHPVRARPLAGRQRRRAA